MRGSAADSTFRGVANPMMGVAYPAVLTFSERWLDARSLKIKQYANGILSA